mmetsp:Transcript_10426/g.28449  ORF Transcript_10426/g.28449 Transcript_10426/m.28449 type:complete len:223 (-) Transcript_10426:1163-1831(-)
MIFSRLYMYRCPSSLPSLPSLPPLPLTASRFHDDFQLARTSPLSRFSSDHSISMVASILKCSGSALPAPMPTPAPPWSFSTYTKKLSHARPVMVRRAPAAACAAIRYAFSASASPFGPIAGTRRQHRTPPALDSTPSTKGLSAAPATASDARCIMAAAYPPSIDCAALAGSNARPLPSTATPFCVRSCCRGGEMSRLKCRNSFPCHMSPPCVLFSISGAFTA